MITPPTKIKRELTFSAFHHGYLTSRMRLTFSYNVNLYEEVNKYIARKYQLGGEILAQLNFCIKILNL